MAELEVAKHIKKTYKIWNDKDASTMHKIKEFAIEIGIIVFAVTLSIWLHDLSEKAHQQKEVRIFLKALRSDVINDSLNVADGRVKCAQAERAFSYINNLKIHDKVNEDSIKKYSEPIFSISLFIAHDGRFEGFKSAGKMGTIEEEELQNDIMDLYQEDIPATYAALKYYGSYKEMLFENVIKNHKALTDSTSNLNEVLESNEVGSLSQILYSINTRVDEKYGACQLRMRKIIAEIDSLYKN